MKTLSVAVAASALIGLAGPARADNIVRCIAPNGSVTYQQIACPDASRQQAAGIASEYPPPNFIERERLLAKEQEMYRRLEAQRERDTQVEMARQARAAMEARAREAEAASAASAAGEPYYIAWPPGPRGRCTTRGAGTATSRSGPAATPSPQGSRASGRSRAVNSSQTRSFVAA